MQRVISHLVFATILAVPCVSSCNTAQAATRYVAMNNVGSCPHHSSLGTSFISCADSKTNGCTLAKPCCTLQDASDKAVSNDVIEMHDGTRAYTTMGYPMQSSNCNQSPPYNDYAAKIGYRPTSGQKSNISVQAATGDTPILDLGTSLHNGILVGGNNITLRGITVIGGSTSPGITGSRISHITICDDAGNLGITGANIDGNTISRSSADPDHGSEFGIYSHGGTFADAKVQNNIISGKFDVAISSDASTANASAIIRNNVITLSTAGGQFAGCMSLSKDGNEMGTDNQNQTGYYLVYNNKCIRVNANSGDSRCFYIREEFRNIYMWNNVCSGFDIGLNFQDDFCWGSGLNFHDENVWIFNNTFTDSAGGAAVANWYINFNAHLANNLIDNYSVGFNFRPDGTSDAESNGATCSCGPAGSCRDDHPRSDSYSFIKNTVCDGPVSPCTYYTGGAGTVTSSASIVGAITLDGTYHLSSGSIAIGAGTNNPIGQGANTCSLTVLGETISCLTDFEGDAHGTSWDVGADQYTTGAGSRPARVTGLTVR